MAIKFSVSFEGDDDNRKEVERRNKPVSEPREQASGVSNIEATEKLDRKELLLEAKQLDIAGRTRMKNADLKAAIDAKKKPAIKPNVLDEARKIETTPFVPPEDKANYRKFLLAEAKKLNIHGRTRMKNDVLAKAVEDARIASSIPAMTEDDSDISFDTDALDAELEADRLAALNSPESTPSSPEVTEPDLLSYEGGGGKPPNIPPGTLQADMPDDEDDEPELFSHPYQGGESPQVNTSEEPDLFSNPFAGGEQPSGPIESLPELDIPFNPKEDPKKARKIVEKHEAKMKADELRRKRSELTAAKRRADKQNVINAKNERLRRREQKNAITASNKAKKALLKEQASRGNNDRLVRRLTSFGIGRAAGIEGGLVTALAEILIVNPETQAAEEQLKLATEQLNQEFEQETGSLESAKTKTSINRDQQSLDIAETIDEARLALAEGEDVDPAQVENVLKDILDKNVEIDPATGTPNPTYTNTGSSASGSGYTPNFTMGGSGSSGGSGSGSGGGGVGGGSGNAGSSGSGNGGNRGNSPNGLVSVSTSPINTATNAYVQSMAQSTKAMLGTYVGLMALKVASDSATKSIDKIGQILTTPDSVAPMAQGVGGVGKVAGSSVGAMVGSAFGPIGTVAGFIIGKAVSSAIIDPLVSLITTAESIMGSSVKSSIGPKTIFAKVESQLSLLNQRLAISERLDDDTASYVSTTNEFAMSINDLKSAVVPLITPMLNAVILSFTKLARIVEVGTLILDAVMSLTGIKAILEASNWYTLRLLEAVTNAINWITGRNNNSAMAITTAIYDFFGGNPAQASSGSMNTNVRRNTPISKNPSLTNNILAFP
jgi:hypothetical protein